MTRYVTLGWVSTDRVRAPMWGVVVAVCETSVIGDVSILLRSRSAPDNGAATDTQKARCCAAGWVSDNEAGAGGCWDWLTGHHGLVIYGPAGISPVAIWRKRSASGQAAAKAMRTRAAVSMMRAPSFKRRRRRVVNSAVASAWVWGTASRMASISQ